MQSSILLLTVLLCSFPIDKFSVEKDEDIRWSASRQLTYEDFTGRIPAATPWAALTSSYIYFSYSFTNNKLTDLEVYTGFKKSESWMKKKSPAILLHEQLHFDLTEVYARKLYSDAVRLKHATWVSGVQMNAIFRRINDECDHLQEQYDHETDHGINEEQQQLWDKKIKEMLGHYESYPIQ